MKILFNDLFEDASVLATNQSLNYPVANIVHPFLHKRFQSTGSGSVVTATWDSPQCMSCFFYAYHNLTSLTVVYKDWGGNTIYTLEIDETEDIGVKYFTAISNVYSVEVSINKITVLIGSDGVEDSLFDTATYIPEGGIYPAYENQLRNKISDSNIVDTDLVNGTITGHVPTASSNFNFQLPIEFIENTKEYTVHYSSSVALTVMSIRENGDDNTTYATVTQATTGEVSFNKIDDNPTYFIFYVDTADKEENITVKYTIVPKGYPQLQEWAGSGLSATLSGDEKSYTIQLETYLNQDTPLNSILTFTSSNLLNRFSILRWQESRYLVRVYTNEAGTAYSYVNLNIDSSLKTHTISISDTLVSVYENETLLQTVSVEWTDRPTNLNIDNVDDLGYNIKTLITSTKESTGYAQDTEFQNDATLSYIGKIAGGCCYTMPDVNASYESGNSDNSDSSSSAYGQRLVNNIPKLRELSYSFRELSLGLKNEIDALYTSKNIFFDLYENNRTKEPPIYGYLIEPFSFPYEARKYSLNMKIGEAK